MDRACLALWTWLGLVSLVGIILAAHDKRQARRSARRVRERTLWLWALVGAWPGLLLAFLVVRHKTRKGRFLVPFFLAAIANGAVVVLLGRKLDCF